uniref:Uncharacterized protein n=1 Tax=Anopheles melas TaxID=34690 RepID=A0A182TVI4_9DIPT
MVRRAAIRTPSPISAPVTLVAHAPQNASMMSFGGSEQASCRAGSIPGQEVVRAGEREPHQLAHHLRPQAAMDVVRVEPFGRRRLGVREQYAHRFALHLACVGAGRGDRRDALHQRVGAEQRLDQRQVAELRVPALDQVGDELAQDVDERAEQLGEQHALLARQAGRVDGRLVEVVRQLVEDGEQQRLPVRRVELEQRVLVLELGVPARLLVVVVRRYAEQPDQPQRGDEVAREGGHVLEAAAHQLHQRPDVNVREQIVQLEWLEVDGQLLQRRADARLELLVLLGQGEQCRPVLGQIADGFPVPHGTVHQIDTVADDRRAMLGGGRIRPTDALLRHRALLALEQLQQHRQIVVHREHLHDEAAPGPAGQLVQGVQAVHQPVSLLLQLIVRWGDAAGARVRDRVQMIVCTLYTSSTPSSCGRDSSDTCTSSTVGALWPPGDCAPPALAGSRWNSHRSSRFVYGRLSTRAGGVPGRSSSSTSDSTSRWILKNCTTVRLTFSDDAMSLCISNLADTGRKRFGCASDTSCSEIALVSSVSELRSRSISSWSVRFAPPCCGAASAPPSSTARTYSCSTVACISSRFSYSEILRNSDFSAKLMRVDGFSCSRSSSIWYPLYDGDRK